MKLKQTVLILGLATFGLVSFAQDNKPDPAPAVPVPPNTEPGGRPAKVDRAEPAKTDPAVAEPVKAEVATPQPVTPLAQAAPAAGQAAPANPPPPNPNEVVPLIVIDDVPLTDAIRNLARQSNLNFQFDPRITPLGADGKPTNQPNVSIRFENVTAQEALQAVLDNYNLVLIRDQKSKIARVTVKDPKAEDPLFSRTIQLKYSDPTNLITMVKSTLSARSSVMADQRTSQLIVTTTEKEMDGVMNLVAKLDTPTRQVRSEEHTSELQSRGL